MTHETEWKSKTNEIHIPAEDPFKNDLLKRKPCADILTNIINTESGPYVLAINTIWGGGKTTFIKMWEQHLKNEGYQTIYFNAWEVDFATDPLVAVLSEIKNRLKLNDKFLEKLKANLPELKGVTSNVILKLLSGGALSSSDFINQNFADKPDQIITSLLDGHEAKKNLRKNFKELLEKKIIEDSNTQNKCVFFIDELDRCKPDFAIKLLETIKHLFDIPGMIFVLSIHKEQLGHALRTVYGQNMSVDGYLRRFIDLEYKLPEPETSVFIDFIANEYGVKNHLKKLNTTPNLWGGGGWDSTLKPLMSILAKEYNLSLRDIEYLLRQFVLICRTTPFIFLPQFAPIFILFLTIRTHKPDLYKKCCNRKISPRELMKSFDHIAINFNISQKTFADMLHKLEGILLCLLETHPPKYIDMYDIKQLGIKSDDPKYHLYEIVCYIYHRFKDDGTHSLELIIETIELTQPFIF